MPSVNLDSAQGHNPSNRKSADCGQLNPQAGTFEPTHSRAVTASTVNRTATHPALAMDDAPSILTQLSALRDAVVDELCSLRRDVDTLARGGWQLTVGPFQALQQADPNNVNAVRHRMFSAINRQADNDIPKATTDGVVQAHTNMEVGSVSEITLRPSTLEKSPCISRDRDRDVAAVTQEVSELALSNASPRVSPSAAAVAPQSTALEPDDPDDPDKPRPSIEDRAGNARNSHWVPLAVRNLPPVHNLPTIPDLPQLTGFTWDFLMSVLGGTEHSPGLYYVPLSHGLSTLPKRTYYVIDRTHEPYLPKAPGHHGAKLTALFNGAADDSAEGSPCYENVPLFITTGEKRYFYFGTYSQLRWSDKLDYDRMMEAVPHDVKMYHAELLADPARPKWVTEQLMGHFWPKPVYEGRIPTGQGLSLTPTGRAEVGGTPEDKEMRKVGRDLKEYLAELRAWEKDAKLKVGLLRKEAVLEQFEAADAADPPGLRLWWEYLQCVGFDSSFYTTLAKMQAKERAA